ncbi:MAG: trimeric intracellular cation channel family protein [Candidatus Acidiferrum sp.]
MKFESDRILFAADMAGTLLFAVEGAISAIDGNLDLLGLMVLAFATALGGGIARDVLIGDVPPAALRDWRYAAVAFSGGTLVIFLHHFVQAIPMNLIVVLDAAGLAFFAIAGTEKTLLHNMHPFIAVLLGTVTAVGGGTIRDLFLARVPRVLEADVYATAALAGSVVMILGRKLRLSPTVAALVGGLVCFLLRVISMWQHWNLPKVSGH